jgi:RNA polymerase subunit RPABC4/transcription elongation factor Spt4
MLPHSAVKFLKVPKLQILKCKIATLQYIKMCDVCASQNVIRKWQSSVQETIFANDTNKKIIVSKIHE